MRDELSQLAVAQALYQELGRTVRTGDPGNLRGRCDAYLADGITDRLNVSIGGERVGSLSARWSKARTYLRVTDRSAFADWCCDDGIGYVREWIAGGMRGSLADYCAAAIIADGEVPAGCEAVEEPERFDGTVLRVDSEKVAAAFGRNIAAATVYALTGDAS